MFEFEVTCDGLAQRVAGLVVGAVLCCLPLSADAQSKSPVVVYAEQGWTPADRDFFYATGQGSHLIPYAWFKALRRVDIDAPFGADQLQRYGYLRNDSPKNVEGLPVGFVIQGSPALGQLGMTCAACHTGALTYKKGDVQYELSFRRKHSRRGRTRSERDERAMPNPHCPLVGNAE